MRLEPVPRHSRFSDPDWYIWGGSMVEDDGACQLFYSRWPRELGMNAWVTHSEIAHAVAIGTTLLASTVSLYTIPSGLDQSEK